MFPVLLAHTLEATLATFAQQLMKGRARMANHEALISSECQARMEHRVYSGIAPQQAFSLTLKGILPAESVLDFKSWLT